MKQSIQTAINQIKAGGIGVIPTDTLYGLVGSATSPKAVERIYQVKHRNPDKPLIILISDITQLNLFNITVSEATNRMLAKHWPGPVSILLPCPNPSQKYLHRGTEALAFRLPSPPTLQEFINQTGPLVAPSANPEGEIPANNLAQAKEYFGEKIDFYLDGLTKPIGQPSKLIKVTNHGVEILRP